MATKCNLSVGTCGRASFTLTRLHVKSQANPVEDAMTNFLFQTGTSRNVFALGPRKANTSHMAITYHPAGGDLGREAQKCSLHSTTGKTCSVGCGMQSPSRTKSCRTHAFHHTTLASLRPKTAQSTTDQHTVTVAECARRLTWQELASGRQVQHACGYVWEGITHAA